MLRILQQRAATGLALRARPVPLAAAESAACSPFSSTLWASPHHPQTDLPATASALSVQTSKPDCFYQWRTFDSIDSKSCTDSARVCIPYRLGFLSSFDGFGMQPLRTECFVRKSLACFPRIILVRVFRSVILVRVFKL